MPASSSEHRHQHQWPWELVAAVNVTADVVFFASNCNSDFRQSWVEGLMEAMPVDSYGACFKNKEMPEGLDRRQRNADPDTTFEDAPGSEGTACVCARAPPERRNGVWPPLRPEPPALAATP